MSQTIHFAQSVTRARLRKPAIEIDRSAFGQRAELLARVAEELQAQDDKWGEQNHPLVMDYSEFGLTREGYGARADLWKRENDQRAKNGTLAWDGIQLEEVYEALAEDDAERAVTELIQTAAVAISAAASIQRNGLDGAQ